MEFSGDSSQDLADSRRGSADSGQGFSTLICKVEVVDLNTPRRPSYQWKASTQEHDAFKAKNCTTRRARGSFDSLVNGHQNCDIEGLCDDDGSSDAESEISFDESPPHPLDRSFQPEGQDFRDKSTGCSEGVDNPLLSWGPLADFVTKNLERQYIWSMAISDEQQAELAQITEITLSNDLARNSDWAERIKLSQDIAFAFRKGVLEQNVKQVEASLEAQAQSLESSLLELGSPQESGEEVLPASETDTSASMSSKPFTPQDLPRNADIWKLDGPGYLEGLNELIAHNGAEPVDAFKVSPEMMLQGQNDPRLSTLNPTAFMSELDALAFDDILSPLLQGSGPLQPHREMPLSIHPAHPLYQATSESVSRRACHRNVVE